jgi:hypothetical protein
LRRDETDSDGDEIEPEIIKDVPECVVPETGREDEFIEEFDPDLPG